MDDWKTLLEALAQVNDEVDFANETALVDDGLLDSLELTRIIAVMDEAFHVRIAPGDIEPENFNSAQAMLELVRRYQAQA